MKIDVSRLSAAVNDAHARHAQAPGGANASYIPYLAKVPSHLAGVAAVTVDGDQVVAGDADYAFAIESISKVCSLVQALEDHGPDAVREKIGADPTGLPFNSVMALALHDGKPLSPLVNAGAIATVSFLKAANAEERWKKILTMQSALAGADIALSDEVNQSEQTTNFHNRAIAWLLYSASTMYSDPMEACEVYTRQCSTLFTARHLATMAATLAAKGRNPLTGKQVLKPEHVPSVLAEMMMEGLYERSGDWAYTVGLPGKSGVGGGIMAVVPGVMGLAAFSPPLDPAGNSVRGQLMVADVARTLGLNLFDRA
ncbi:glutaminase A [Bordetella avium]|uniref:glutaminase A n=1 Tax=Bordetella avium TaxID=521 RepID=UPI000E0AB775|nr:glutaminase A [Bordetella avium]RIQ11844.1 glutaminase [Bordetella avium]RIQ37491.1 glutaminase [Bordetella avium]RIQ38989.1 glutaminase [Bordetella avium]RIQ40333.1 glutaminase [Bordetella avium]RIQ46380.1 glutaminase [Bordetella avium]